MNKRDYLKSFAIALAGAVLFLIRAPYAHAAAGSMFLNPASQTITQGSSYSVTVHEDSGTDTVNAVNVNLTYPTDKLTYTGVTYTGSPFDIQTGATASGGSVKLSVGKTPPAVSGDQIVAIINFQAIAPGTANVNFGCNYNASTCPQGNAVLRDSDNTNILTSTTPASVLITSLDHLTSGQTLSAGQALISSNVQYTLVMQGDGNLVLYGNNMKPLWYSATSGTGANRVVMQGDGNLVIYTSTNRAVWASTTSGQGASHLDLQDDGNLVLYNSSSVATWHTHTGGHPSYTYNSSDRLTASQTLTLGHYLRSPDGRCALLLQTDGNLVLYGAGYHVLWYAGTSNQGVANMVMQGDGNLVIYTSTNRAVWASTTSGQGNSFAVVQNDGNFVVYTTPGNVATWNSGTGGKI
jgi:hypothetical protein